MLPLRELQRRFDSALFDDPSSVAATWVRDTESDSADGAPIDPDARIAIYRNNLREGFRKALALEFPVIERLVGEDYFRQLALSFLAEHPSRAGDLHPIGEPFARFLQTRFAATPYEYMADVATLEWAYQQSAIAADAAPFEVASLRDIAPEAYGQLCFPLHPACGLVRSPYPVLRIWAVNQPDASGDEIVDLSSGADFVLLRRDAQGVEMRRITAADFAILQAFSRQVPLAQSLEQARALDPEFDLGEALRRFISLGVLAAAHLTHSTSSGATLP